MDNDKKKQDIPLYPTGLYKYPLDERIKLVAKARALSSEEYEILQNPAALPTSMADQMVENVISIFGLPMGIATNFLIDGKHFLIPMVTEESSVIAAASNAAKIVSKTGGFFTKCTEPIMGGQIQITRISPHWTLQALEACITHNYQELQAIAQNKDPRLYAVGGGLRTIKCKEIATIRGRMQIIEFEVNVKNAMGANIVNTLAEAFATFLQPLIPGKILLRIISNLSIQRIATASAVFDPKHFGGIDIAESILDAYAFAEADPARASTHNKGIMNGITALALATGNDTRAIEAAAHSYAALSGKYRPLTTYSLNSEGMLVGELSTPVPLGIIGGITSYHPTAKIALKILGVTSAEELGKITAAVGLAQNFAALRALVSEGIQQGHMKLHARKP
jgi:hydroxymethylglutaryl-CoA reductase